MNLSEFYEKIHLLFEKYDDVDLDKFLLSVFGIIDNYSSQECRYELILELIEKSLLSRPIEFPQEWMSITSPPDDGRMARKFTNPEIYKLDTNTHSNRGGINYSIAIIKFQCAEFERMRDNALKDEYRYFGVISPSGHSWYNFSAFSVLECGSRCMIDNGDDFENLDWSIFGDLLEDGRVYE